MNKMRKTLMEQGIAGFPEEEIRKYEQDYQDILAKGRKENRKTHHKHARSDESVLLNRMEKYSRNHLLFLHNFSVPFENNISERDLRKVKNRQKMAGGFRKESGHKMYCSILTIVETLKRRKMGIIENIRQLFMGAPALYPVVHLKAELLPYRNKWRYNILTNVQSRSNIYFELPQ